MYSYYDRGDHTMPETAARFGVPVRRLRDLFRREGLARRRGPLYRSVRERERVSAAASAAKPAFGREYLLECLAMVADEVGRTPGGDVYDRFAREWSLPSRSLIIQRFDSWGEACLAAGLKPNTVRAGYSRAFTYGDVLEAVRECARETGSLPTVEGYDAWQRSKREGLGLGRTEAGPYPSIAKARLLTPGTRWGRTLTDAFPDGSIQG